MPQPHDIDDVLVQWGDRLFYPGNRIVKERRQPRLAGNLLRDRAAVIRARIEATVVRRAPQVMVKVTGGGRGMKAIAAHIRYISKNGRLDIEDELGNVERGKQAVRELADDWRFGGSFIDEVSDRREAFNIMLSMPRGVDALIVQRAAREFAQAELADHKYVMVLHDHQANPHVHISVRAESKHGRRLNPRKADLQRWRETFARALRGWGIDAEATRQATRGADRNHPAIWQTKAAARGSLRTPPRPRKTSAASIATRLQARAAWSHILDALRESANEMDRRLAPGVAALLAGPERRSQGVRTVAGRVGPSAPESNRSSSL
ncbi:MAG: conjugal transfer protein TraS [Caldimonas sp.]